MESIGDAVSGIAGLSCSGRGSAVRPRDDGVWRHPVRPGTRMAPEARIRTPVLVDAGQRGLYRADATQRKRTGAWLKVRFNRRQELVIGGYKPSAGNFESLLVRAPAVSTHASRDGKHTFEAGMSRVQALTARAVATSKTCSRVTNSRDRATYSVLRSGAAQIDTLPMGCSSGICSLLSILRTESLVPCATDY